MKNKLYFLVGIVASGKSTIAKNLSQQHNAQIYSSDDIRKELYGNEMIQDDPKTVFKLLHNRIKNGLLYHNCIYDATSINFKKRMEFLQEIKDIDCEKICVFIATPYEKCLKQNETRDRFVPEYVIKKMYKNIYIPQYYEGWDKIEIIWNFNKDDFNVEDLFTDLCQIKQDNPYHTLSIGDHCKKCVQNLSNSGGITDSRITLAALYHDIGKKFCKTFENSKGEKTDTAHFYQHHLVSAYMALFYLKIYGFSDNDILEICNLIMWHMRLYEISKSGNPEKSIDKFKNLVGEKVYKNLKLLHAADVSAK